MLVPAQTGNYFISNYSPGDYNASGQNFDIIQDDFGLICVANNSALLIYNGKSWSSIRIPGGKSPVSLAKSDDGNIYVGSENEFGMLKRDSKGRRHYHSLTSALEKNERDFTVVWNTLAVKNEVFFCAGERIIRYSNGRFKTWKPSLSFHDPHIVNGHLIVREVGVGLMCLEGDKLKKIKDSEVLAPAEFKMACLIPWKAENEYLIITRKKGVFYFFSDPADPLKSAIIKAREPMFKAPGKIKPCCGLALENGNIVIGTRDQGIFVFNRRFKLLQKINSVRGCMDDAVRKLFIDRQKNLWVAFDNGVSQIAVSSPLTKWDKYSQVQGRIESMVFFKGGCFLAASKGLLKLDTAERIFERIGIADQCRDLEVVKGKLYIGSESGLWQFDGKNFDLLYDKDMVNRVAYSPDFPGWLFCACSDGIAVIDIESGRKIKEITSPVESDVLYMAFTSDKRILASTKNAGMYYCDPVSEENVVVPESPYYVKEHENFIAGNNGRIYIGSDSGLIFLEAGVFRPWKEISSFFRGQGVSNFTFRGNEIYIHSGTGRGEGRTFCVSSAGESIAEKYPVLGRLSGTAVRKFYFNQEYVNICTDNGVFILDRSGKPDKSGIRIYLANVIRNGDTLICDLENGTHSLPSFAFGDNRLVFEFGSNDFSDESRLLFQYYLEGYENGFNRWTADYRAFYNNIQLREGQYAFHLRAKNVYGEISPGMILRFKINPPWYRSRVAYVFYILVPVVLVWLIVALSTKRLRKQNRRLRQKMRDLCSPHGS